MSFDALANPEKLGCTAGWSAVCAAPSVEHRLVGALAVESLTHRLGRQLAGRCAGHPAADTQGGGAPAHRHAQLFGPRRALTGEPRAPTLPTIADAQQRGLIGAEHVRVVERFFPELPASVDYQNREAAEADLARIAVGLGPAQLRQAADRLMALINPRRSATA